MDIPSGPVALDMSREARRSKISDSVHSRSEYIVGVSGDPGIKIKSSCESGGDELLKLLQLQVLLPPLKNRNFRDIASHVFNSLPELFIPGIKIREELLP